MKRGSEEAFAAADDALTRGAYLEAFEIAKPWVDEGHDWAESCIGSLYQCGLGVKQDLEEAVRLFRRAADHGSAGAWYSLGVIYDVGGVNMPPNPELAGAFYQKARELGYFPGQPYIRPLR